MDPWTVLGWLLVVVVSLPVLVIGLGIVTTAVVGVSLGILKAYGALKTIPRRISRLYKHLRTRNTSPAAGQIWSFRIRGGDFNNTISRVWENDDGGLTLRGWASYTPVSWAKYVRTSKAYLVGYEK